MRSRRFKIVSLLSVLWGCWWTFFGLASGVIEGFGVMGTLTHTVVPGLIFLVTALLAQKRNFIGGILLVVEGALATWLFEYFWPQLLAVTDLLMVCTLGLPFSE